MDVAEKDGRPPKLGEDVFVIRPHVWQEMLNHCQQHFPLEACGLLSGRNRCAETIWKMDNTAASPNAFRMDEQQLQIVFNEMKKRGHDLVGIYHSHPAAPPVPSPLDILYAAYEDVFYIIVSLANQKPAVGCFRIVGKKPYSSPYVMG